jgi:ubiquinone biosynthesis protein
MAQGYGADLILCQVVPSVAPDGTPLAVDPADLREAEHHLGVFAQKIAGPRGHGRVVAHEDPATGILEVAQTEEVDVIVVGNVGMAGRKEFLLGNIPNRISHKATCTVVIVNTSVPSQAMVLPPPPIAGEGRDRRLLQRAWRIGRIMVRAGLKELLNKTDPRDEEALRQRARRFREALEEAGPTFAKLGQILSTRPDLLPPVFIEELAALQERVTPLSERDVVGAAEAAMGVPWEDVFESIDPKPLAAGTIAQVHRATLENGDRVVVKIQRPNAERDIFEDLGLLELFALKAAERPGIRRLVDLNAIVDHLSSSLRRELDFRREASNLKRMKEVLRDFRRLDVPRVYEEYSGPRLLVMEEVQGVPVRQAPEGPERKDAARQFLESFYSQVMSDGFFHADPHPGNLKWWNGKIYFLDLGMVGEIEPSLRELLLMMLLAFAQEDTGFLSDIVLLLASGGLPMEEVNLPGFREEVAGLVQRYRDLSLREIQVAELMQQVTEISFRHNVRVPAALMLASKAFAQMQLVAAELDPTLDPFSVAGSMVLRNTVGQLTSFLNPQNLLYETQKARVRFFRVLEAVEGLIGARPGSPLQVNFHGTERLEAVVGRSARQLSLALGAGSAIVGAAMTANSERSPSWVSAAMGGLGAVLSGALLLELRRKPSEKQ